MKYVVAFLTPALMALSLHAGDVKVDAEKGLATVVSKVSFDVNPDYIEYSLTIHSRCFSIDTINETHDDFVKSVQTAFTSYFAKDVVNTTFNKVETSPGPFGKYNKWISGPNNTNIQVCQNTYERYTYVTIKTKDTNITSWLTKIYKDIGSIFATASGQDETSAGTTCDIPSYTAKLCDEKRKDWENQALSLACDRALDRFRNSYKNKPIDWSTVKCIGHNPVGSQRPSPLGFAMARSKASNESSVEYSDATMTISECQEFYFTFKPWNVPECASNNQTGGNSSKSSNN